MEPRTLVSGRRWSGLVALGVSVSLTLLLAGVLLVTLPVAATDAADRALIAGQDFRMRSYSVLAGPDHLDLTADPTFIPANGLSFSALTAVVSDTQGDPVLDGTVVVFSTTLGTFPAGLTTTPTPTGETTVEAEGGGVTKVGDWQPFFNLSCSNSYGTYSNTEDDEVTHTFTGTGVSVLFQTRADLGIAHVYVDDVLYQEIDTYSAAPLCAQEELIAEGLPYTEHEVRVVVSGLKHDDSTGITVAVDAIRVVGVDRNGAYLTSDGVASIALTSSATPGTAQVTACADPACDDESVHFSVPYYLPLVRVNYPLPLPRPPRRLSPADGTVTKSQAITFTWEPRSKGGPVDGYNLKVDGIIFTTTDTFSPTTLAYGEHRWTVRAYNSSGYSPWASPLWVVHVTDTLPPPSCYPYMTTTVDVGDVPHGVAVNSDADRLYIANHADDTLTVINTATYSPVVTVDVGDGPNGVAYNPANDMIYVANRNDGSVSVLRTSDYSLTKTIDVGSEPNGVAVNEVTNQVYVANYSDGTVSVIDGASNTVSDTVAAGLEPSMIAVNTVTNKAYVSLHGEAKVAVIDGAGDVSTIDLYDSTGPYGIAVDMLRNYVYVATIDTARIVVVDGRTDSFLDWAEIRRLSDGALAPLRMIAVNPDIGPYASGGHIFATTVGGDGGWDKFLLLPKGWDEGFARAHALDLSEPREGLAFEPGSNRVYATSRGDDLVAVFQDGVPVCPQNFVMADGYEVWVCGADSNGNCTETDTR